jgi:hypothetical protein
MTIESARTGFRTRRPVRVFDLVDGFALERGLTGAHPRPIGAVRVLLLADGAQTFARPPELVLGYNRFGYAVSYGRLRYPDGAERAGTFGVGPYRLRVLSEHYQTSDLSGVELPAAEPLRVELAAGYTYPFPVAITPPARVGDPTVAALTLLRGAVFAPDGSGVAGAVVDAPTAVSYRIGADGQWVLVFPDGAPASELVDVTITAPGANPVVVREVRVTPAGEATLAQTALRGTVRAPGVDPRTVAVRVTGLAGQAGVRADGAWSCYFPLDHGGGRVTVTATLPDGRRRTVPDVEVTPRRTTIVPEFSFPPEAMRSRDA